MRFQGCAAGLAIAIGAGMGVAQAASVTLAGHRAVYELSLVRGAGGSSAVEAAKGRIAFDFQGDACDGYATTFRQVTVLESSEAGARTSDFRSTTFESGDGATFRFKRETQRGETTARVDGSAERGGQELRVDLRQPKRERLDLSAAAVFPTSHMKRLVAAARAGETTLTLPVFDGSDDGRRASDTLAVIGRPIAPGQGAAAVEEPLRLPAMAAMRRWPVTLSYFAPGSGERMPTYVIGFELYENGVSRALRLDYGEFTLQGDISRLDLAAPSACQR